MTVQLSKRLINVSEYHGMAEAGILKPQDKVELIHGEILEMSPIGSKHAAIVVKLNKLFNHIISDDQLISIQNPICINDLNEPEPDISVLKAKADFYAESHPKGTDTLLVIEVSDSTLSYDKEIKLPLYATGGVPEYWIINLQKNEIEVHRSPEGDVYKRIQIAQQGDTIELMFNNQSIEVNQLLG